MNFIFILFSLFLLINCKVQYQLSLDIFFYKDIKFNLDLINKRLDKEISFYYGLINEIEEIININTFNNKKVELKDGNFPLVYISDWENIRYINLFPITTIFIIQKEDIKYLKNGYQNYTIFSLDSSNEFFLFYNEIIDQINLFYIKIGEEIDDNMKLILYIIIFINTFICLLISLSLTKIIKKMNQENLLPIYFLIRTISNLLFSVNIGNGLSFLFFYNKEYYFIIEYITLFLYSLYKSVFYSLISFILLGWTTIFFYGIGERFQKLNKKILLYDLIFTILILFSIYMVQITSKLNFFYIKNISENLPLLCFTIYCIFKKLIPLTKQKNYEQRIRSDLIKCIAFKFKRLFFSTLIIILYSFIILITPILDYIYIYNYIDNFNVYLIFQLLYESICILFYTLAFFPKKLPRYYFDEILFNYKVKVFLLANISEEESDIINKNSKNLNISNLTFDKLKKISKKDNYPIVLINPYYNSEKKISLFENIHLGIAQRLIKNK